MNTKRIKQIDVVMTDLESFIYDDLESIEENVSSCNANVEDASHQLWLYMKKNNLEDNEELDDVLDLLGYATSQSSLAHDTIYGLIEYKLKGNNK
jgi:hypothetical protein